VKGNAVPNVVVDPAREALVSSASGVLLGETVKVRGVRQEMDYGVVAVAIGSDG